MHVELKVFGPVGATLVGGAPAGEPLTQPRPLALLAYLVLARPRGPHARDTLVDLLWPSADRGSGRQGLRNALHRLRTALGPDLIVTSGETLVAVDPSRIRCDALDFEAAVGEKRWEDAWKLCTGELLQGFHVGDAPDFERWLDAERDRMRSAASAVAEAVARAARAEGDVPAAVAAARSACELFPYDEQALRHLLEVLAAAGDRAAALHTYDEFSRRLAHDLEAEPSATTQALVRAIRAGDIAADIAAGPAPAWGAPPTIRPTDSSASRAVPRKPRGAPLLGAALAAGLLSVLWLSPSLWPARSAAPGAAAPDPLTTELAERWRADTTHFSAYLAAQARLADAEITEGRQSFLRLTKEAPLYAPAWAGLSVALYRSAFDDMPPRMAMSQALQAAQRALSLDEEMPDAVETVIAYDLFYRWDLAKSKARLDSAIARYPAHAEFYNLLATWHRFRGELDASLDLKEANTERDPLSPRYAFQIASSLYFAHRCAEAAAVYRRLPAEVRSARGNDRLYRALACAGRDDEAADALREAALQGGDTVTARRLEPPLSPEQRDAAVRAVFRDRLERQLTRRREAWVAPEWIMLQYAELQNADSTLLWLDTMYAERSMMLYVVPFDPLNDFLRDDPRFDEFVGRLSWLEPTRSGAP